MKKYISILFLLLTVRVSAQIWETNDTKRNRPPISTNEILQLVLIVIVILSVTYGIAAMRKGKFSMSKPYKILSFNAGVSIDKAMKLIIQFANQNGYKIDDFNESKFIIVLSNSATITSYGFFFPVYLTRQGDNTMTFIEVGIKSKLIQWGPIVSRNHEKCFNGIKATIFANG